MSYDTNIIRFLRQKTTDGFDNITWLGAEQRFVAPLRNSNLNNLEEQYVLGTDTYTVEYTDSNNNINTTTCYCKVPNGEAPEEQTDYYKLVTIKYAEPQEINDELYTSLSSDALGLHYNSNGAHSIVAGGSDLEHPESDSLYYENPNDLKIQNINGINVGTIAQGFKIAQKSTLLFIKLNENITVAEKYTLTKDELITEEGINAKITKEIIINHLQES